MKKRRFKKRIFVYLLEVFFFMMFIYSIYNISSYFINSKKNDDIKKEIFNNIEEIKEDNKHVSLEEKYNVDFKSLKQINEETVGFLKVNGTNIEYPVVKTTNNYSYLNKSYDKSFNSFGWIFANYLNKLDGTDKNITIFGHAMLNGTMFGTLKNVLTDEWRNDYNNRRILFMTEDSVSIYEVFSTYKVLDEYYFFKSGFINNEFTEFIQTIKNRSDYDYNVEVNENDSILTLATCDNDDHSYRVILHAKKI